MTFISEMTVCIPSIYPTNISVLILILHDFLVDFILEFNFVYFILFSSNHYQLCPILLDLWLLKLFHKYLLADSFVQLLYNFLAKFIPLLVFIHHFDYIRL